MEFVCFLRGPRQGRKSYRQKPIPHNPRTSRRVRRNALVTALELCQSRVIYSGCRVPWPRLRDKCRWNSSISARSLARAGRQVQHGPTQQVMPEGASTSAQATVENCKPERARWIYARQLDLTQVLQTGQPQTTADKTKDVLSLFWAISRRLSSLSGSDAQSRSC